MTAQPACPQIGPQPVIEACLELVFGEVRILQLVAGRSVLDIYVNPVGGSWSITLTVTSGASRLIRSGRGYDLPAPSARGDRDG